ncbi:hypothetical protein THIOM_005664 [Candidatus Thiomargarita nelsonii]|uniref:Uncharacterized protein n=1 Tax=Candidatus Thiomargarita nelsonii TaxID=1003181 RepID=A0A176RSI9_9GAMM|nr:hypothetical protein THIOM_005664 [Candidatus Thiomargarita nelsonii]
MNLTPKTVKVLELAGTAGFLSVNTMLKVGWAITPLGGGLLAPSPKSNRIKAPLICARSAKP